MGRFHLFPKNVLLFLIPLCILTCYSKIRRKRGEPHEGMAAESEVKEKDIFINCCGGIGLHVLRAVESEERVSQLQ